MKRAIIAVSGLAMLMSAQALAQTVGVGPAETVVIAPEQRTIIKEYVVKEKVAPVRVQEKIGVGVRTPGRCRVENGSLRLGSNVLEISLRLL